MPSSGSDCRARWASAMPSPSGNLTSVTSTSGESRSSASMADATEAASPTTSRSPARSKALRRPSRMSWWSSTSSTVIRGLSPGTCYLLLQRPAGTFVLPAGSSDSVPTAPGPAIGSDCSVPARTHPRPQ